jgi:hypothetical protein
LSADTTVATDGVRSMRAVAHLELNDPLLDTERVIAMLRTRGYSVDRLTLVGSDLHVWIESSAEHAHLLDARLRRLEGPRLCGALEWRR